MDEPEKEPRGLEAIGLNLPELGRAMNVPPELAAVLELAAVATVQLARNWAALTEVSRTIKDAEFGISFVRNDPPESIQP